VNWNVEGVHTGDIDHTHIMFGKETWFHIIGYVNCQNDSY
jgi:hypothetical protein